MIGKTMTVTALAVILMASFTACIFESDAERIGLSATILSATSVRLQWSNERRSSNLYREESRIYNGSDKSYTDTGLVPSATYAYKVTLAWYDDDGKYRTMESSTVKVTLPSLIKGNNMGEWVRMDTGNAYYINKSNQIKDNNDRFVTDVTIAPQSDRVLKVTQNSDNKVYYLFASRRADGTFTGRVANVQSSSRVARSLLGDVEVTLKNLEDELDSVTARTDSDGRFVANDIIPGNSYEAVVENQATEVTPKTDGDDIGTITVVDQGAVNFKTSITGYYSQLDLMNLIATGTSDEYRFKLSVTNTGNMDCLAAIAELKFDNSLLYSGNTRWVLGTIEPGKTKTMDFYLGCSALTEESVLKKINVTINDTIERKTWDDSVSLKFNRTAVTFNIQSNANIRGVIITPTAKTYPFDTQSSTSLTLPWSSDDYLVIFSGATVDTEATYSLGIGVTPDTGFAEFFDLGNYEPNNTEDAAEPLVYGDKIMSYLHKNDVDFYRVKLR